MANTTLNSEPWNGSWCWLTYFLLIVGKCSWKVVGNYAIWFSFMIDPGENLGCPCFFWVILYHCREKIYWMTDWFSFISSVVADWSPDISLIISTGFLLLSWRAMVEECIGKKCFVILLAKYVFFVKLSSIRLFFSVNIMCGREFTCNI